MHAKYEVDILLDGDIHKGWEERGVAGYVLLFFFGGGVRWHFGAKSACMAHQGKG